MHYRLKNFNFPQKTLRNSAVIPSIPGDLLFFIFFNTIPSSSSCRGAPRVGSDTLPKLTFCKISVRITDSRVESLFLNKET